MRFHTPLCLLDAVACPLTSAGREAERLDAVACPLIADLCRRMPLCLYARMHVCTYARMRYPANQMRRMR